MARKCQRSYNLKQAFAGLCLFEEERAGNTHIQEGDDKDDGGNGDDSDGILP